jgi:hypothetical protein
MFHLYIVDRNVSVNRRTPFLDTLPKSPWAVARPGPIWPEKRGFEIGWQWWGNRDCLTARKG